MEAVMVLSDHYRNIHLKASQQKAPFYSLPSFVRSVFHYTTINPTVPRLFRDGLSLFLVTFETEKQMQWKKSLLGVKFECLNTTFTAFGVCDE